MSLVLARFLGQAEAEVGAEAETEGIPEWVLVRLVGCRGGKVLEAGVVHRSLEVVVEKKIHH